MIRITLLVFTALILSACNATLNKRESTLYQSGSVDILPNSRLEIIVNFETEALRIHEPKILSLIDDAYVHYTELFDGAPKKLDGKPYDRLTVTIFDGFGGEADPETIEIGIDDTVFYGFYNWELTILHEVLHLWSGETFRYADGQEHWFNEGVTEYYTFRLGAKLGMIPQDRVLDTFASPVATYVSANGIGELSPRKAGMTDELKQAHYFLIYHGGYVAGLILDHQIRLETNGEHTLDDVMKELYKSNNRIKLYSMQTLIETVRQSTSVDVSDFLQRYMDGNEVIPVGSYFDFGMLDLMTNAKMDITDENQMILKQMLSFE